MQERSLAKDARAGRRQAAHDAGLAAFKAKRDDPLTKSVAFGICQTVYSATGCACEKRPDMDVCSTMTSAAMGAIRRVRDYG